MKKKTSSIFADAFSEGKTYPDDKPLYSRRHPIVLFGIDITEIPSLIRLYDAVHESVYLAYGVVYNEYEQYWEGEQIEQAGELFQQLANLIVLDYKLNHFK